MNQPLVTIGVPVYNEAKFIAESLENMLGQSYRNLEVLIADNGSTDGTDDIYKRYAAQDSRIRVIRHPQNIGQNANFNLLPREARGTYFCWASAHDLLEKTFVEDCVKALEARPDAVLAYPRTVYLDEHGNKTGEKHRDFDIRSMKAPERFLEVMWRVDCNYVYGMYRLKPMQESHLFQKVPAADRVFLSEMALKGTFVPGETFKYYRPNRGTVPQTELQKRHRLMGFIFPDRTYTDAQLTGNRFYRPTVQACHALVKASGLGQLTKLRLRWSVWLSGIMKYHLFPGADAASAFVKAALPKTLLRKLMGMMQ
jgi:glycosyltransferase involved in cell wall biosynthesis